MYSTIVFAALLALASAAPYRFEKEATSSFEGKKYLPPAIPDVPAKVEKHFYYISAHDEPEQVEHKHFVIGHPKKDYRVIFIKAPSVNTKHKYTIEVPPQHEKTAIYVLAKKNEALNHEDFTVTSSTHTNKPEVFFVKYKNEDEIELAQKEIQGKLLGHLWD